MTPSAALVATIRAGAAVSWPAWEGARLAVSLVVQAHPELRTPELHELLLADRLAVLSAAPAQPPHVPAEPGP